MGDVDRLDDGGVRRLERMPRERRMRIAGAAVALWATGRKPSVTDADETSLDDPVAAGPPLAPSGRRRIRSAGNGTASIDPSRP